MPENFVRMNDFKTPLERLEDAARLKKVARENYNAAIQECVEAGISNTKMAQVLGLSEGAIRMHRHREAQAKSKR